MAMKIIELSTGVTSPEVPSVYNLDAFRVITHTLDSTDVGNEYVTLPVAATTPSQSMLYWEGVGQVYGSDFTIVGAQLLIDGDLVTHIAAGDKLTIFYQ